MLRRKNTGLLDPLALFICSLLMADVYKNTEGGPDSTQDR